VLRLHQVHLIFYISLSGLTLWNAAPSAAPTPAKAPAPAAAAKPAAAPAKPAAAPADDDFDDMFGAEEDEDEETAEEKAATKARQEIMELARKLKDLKDGVEPKPMAAMAVGKSLIVLEVKVGVKYLSGEGGFDHCPNLGWNVRWANRRLEGW